jgi:MFS family permease
MVFTVIATLLALPLGILGDRIGRKGILSSMLGFWCVAGLLIGLSQNFTHAVLTVGLTGIPFAAITVVGYAFMLDLIPPERTAEFIGINIISISLAMVFGPVFSGKLIDTFGYRSVYPGAALFMFTGLVVLQFVKPRSKTGSISGRVQADEHGGGGV